MSIRSNVNGQLTVPYRGTAHNTPCSFSCWAKCVSGVGGGFGAVITMEDGYFNTYPALLNNGGSIIYTPGPGNFTVVADGSKWFYCAASFDGTGGPSTGIGLDFKGVWTVQTTGSSSNGGSGLPSILIGGQSMGSGSSSNDSDVTYRGVHVWTEAKSVQFLKAQAAQLAPISDVNLFSSLWPEKNISNLGYSSVGHKWSALIAGFITSTDEPPVPEVVRRRAFSFSSSAATGTLSSGVVTSAAIF